LVIENDTASVDLLRHHLRDCDLMQVRDTQTLHEMLLTRHPRAIIYSAHSDTQEPVYQALAQVTIPVIEYSLPRPLWTSSGLSLAGSLATPINGVALMEEIRRIGQVCTLLLIVHDRGLVLLIERLLQASGDGKSFELQRAYT